MSVNTAELNNPATNMDTSSMPLRPNGKIRAVKRRKLRSQRLRRQQR